MIVTTSARGRHRVAGDVAQLELWRLNFLRTFRIVHFELFTFDAPDRASDAPDTPASQVGPGELRF